MTPQNFSYTFKQSFLFQRRPQLIYQEKPENFKPEFTAVGCFIKHEGDIVLLLRQDHKPEGNTWGIPTGKIEAGETALEAIQREILEETGLEIPADKISFFKESYVRYEKKDFIYRMYHSTLAEKLPLRIKKDEHKKILWHPMENAIELALIPDMDACMTMFVNSVPT